MRIDENGIVWPDKIPDQNTIKRVLNRIIRKRLNTPEEMTKQEREVFLFTQTNHMLCYLKIKERARYYLANGFAPQQIIDELRTVEKLYLDPKLAALMEHELAVAEGFLAGLTKEQIAARLDIPDKRVQATIDEIKNEDFAKRQVQEQLELYIAEHVWNAVWGPRSKRILAQDNGHRTPAPMDPADEVVFQFKNIDLDAGNAAEAVRYLRRHIDGASPKATVDSIRELLRKFGVYTPQLKKALGPVVRLVVDNDGDDVA
jgi:hypothetical protein